jgi:ABC-type Na+ transport system ATPase subunit NatA
MTLEEEIKLIAKLNEMSDKELLAFQERLMDILIEQKMGDSKIVFSGVENGLLN